MPKRTLSIDPSSTATGWAVWEDDELADYGVMRPPCQLEPDERIRIIVAHLENVIQLKGIEQAVYEEPQKIDASKKKHLWIYKKAVRNVMALLVEKLGRENVYPIDPHFWKGSVKKTHTIRNVNLIYGLSLVDRDSDIADAIGLGEWFLKRQKIHPISSIGQEK